MALPPHLKIPKDELVARLDFYNDNIVLSSMNGQDTTIKYVSALDVAQALTRDMPISSGVLPENVFWWGNRDGCTAGLWRPAQVWKIALQLDPFKPAERLALPMPGLLFLAQPGRAPWVFAAKARPTKMTDEVFNAPLFNIFTNGLSCPGSHKYPLDPSQAPEDFFLSFFTTAGDHHGNRSKKHKDLLKLWRSLNGKKTYPLDDLVKAGTLEQIIARKERG